MALLYPLGGFQSFLGFPGFASSIIFLKAAQSFLVWLSDPQWKHLLLGQAADRYPDVIYLDGIAFFQRDGKTWIQSHHEPAIELRLS